MNFEQEYNLPKANEQQYISLFLQGSVLDTHDWLLKTGDDIQFCEVFYGTINFPCLKKVSPSC